MGICEANGIELLSPSACYVGNAGRCLSLRSESSIHSLSGSYGGMRDRQHQLTYPWDYPPEDRDCAVTEDRFYGKQEVESPYGDELQSEDGSQTVFGASSEQKSSKRKTKRFRLTHNQTRYLMSEFTRQAHPDAAHRERLSREIPGLSPRQVQVWFQNRRAKLKRLSTDDRERMLKSRAVPEDFDMAKALHWPYANYSKVAGAGLFATHNNVSEQKQPQVVIESVKFTGEEYVTAPLSNPPAYGYYTSTPISVPASSSSSDGTPQLYSPGGAEISATSWRYPQIPTPPLESAGVSEAGSFSEPKSPMLNRHWSSVFTEDNAAASSSTKFTPSLSGRLHTPVTPQMNYSDKALASPLSFIDLTERPVSQQDERRSTGGTIPANVSSLFSEDPLLQQSASCLGLSSFGISSAQGPSSTMGFTNSGLGFELGSRFGGLPYPIDTARNMWNIES